MKIPKILRVLYSPSKVFEELAEKPSYKGVILILILFIASNILAVYTVYSKQYVQRTKPDFFEMKMTYGLKMQPCGNQMLTVPEIAMKKCMANTPSHLT